MHHLIMLIRTTLTLILLVRQFFEQSLNLEGAHVLLLNFDSSEEHVSRHMYSIVLKQFMYVVQTVSARLNEVSYIIFVPLGQAIAC